MRGGVVGRGLCHLLAPVRGIGLDVSYSRKNNQVPEPFATFRTCGCWYSPIRSTMVWFGPRAWAIVAAQVEGVHWTGRPEAGSVSFDSVRFWENSRGTEARNTQHSGHAGTTSNHYNVFCTLMASNGWKHPL